MTNEIFEKYRLVKNKTQYAFTGSNYWSSSEYNVNNSWNVNSGSGNINNNNTLTVRPVAALDEERKEAWLDAFDDCCRHKKMSDSCIRYRLKYEEDLWRLGYEVESGVYKPTTSICFCVTRPKLREVFAANFRDRIVHHWLMMKLNPLFEKRFVEQGNLSFNCRKGFGTLAAVQAVRQDIADVSNGYTSDAFIGRFDLVGFFMSINKEILIEQLGKFIYENYKEEDVDLVFKTLCIVINHNPANDCEIHGNKDLFLQLPHNKSLFFAEKNKGLPIGNLTSQILANFHLSFFDKMMDKWCREQGGRYRRFVDDFIVILPDAKLVYKAYLFAKDKLNNITLTLHDDKKYIQHYTKGVKFIGYVIKMERVYLSNRTFGNFYNRLQKFDEFCTKVDVRNPNALQKLSKSMQSINSYIGFTVHTNNYGMRLKSLLKYKRMYKFVYLKSQNHIIKIKKNYQIGELLYEKDRMERARLSSAV